jgi:cytochrome P450
MTDMAATVGFPGFAPKPGHPPYYDDELGAWQVFGYAGAQRVLSEFSVFSSRRGALDPNDTAATGSDSLTDLDPPAHRQIRSLVTSAFTARNVATLAGWVSGVCDALLDAVIDRREMDLIADFSHQLPLRVIGRLVGFPPADLEQLRAWGHSSGDVRSPAAVDTQRKLADYFAALIADRTASPRADLLSELITAQVDGQRLTRTQIAAACVLLLTAGTHTVRDLIGNAWLCFDRHPGALAELRADPTLVPGAVEEVLRYLPPVPQFPRIAAVDTDIDGRPVAAGQWVMARIPSANRDPAEFPRPDQFDIHRRPNRHLTLGHGIHFCLGAPLARMETKIALQTMLRRLREVRIVPDAPLTPHVSPFAYGMEHLPITFTPT